MLVTTVTNASSLPLEPGVNVAVAAAPGASAMDGRGAPNQSHGIGGLGGGVPRCVFPSTDSSFKLPCPATTPTSTYSKPCGKVFSAGIFWRIQKYLPSCPLAGGSICPLNALSASAAGLVYLPSAVIYTKCEVSRWR